MPITGILFDKDGTLFDYAATWMPLNWQLARETAGGDEVLATHLMSVGGWNAQTDSVISGSVLAAGTNKQIAEEWVKHVSGWAAEDLTALLNDKFTSGSADTATPVTDLPAYLNGLKDLGLKLGVATSDSEAGARAMLQQFGVIELMDFIAGFDSGFGAKPAPEVAYGFCDQAGLLVSEIAMVGDNMHDIHMGLNAGVGLNIGVLTGTSTREELAAEADHVLDDITHIPNLLSSLSD